MNAFSPLASLAHDPATSLASYLASSGRQTLMSLQRMAAADGASFMGYLNQTVETKIGQLVLGNDIYFQADDSANEVVLYIAGQPKMRLNASSPNV